MKPVKVGLIGLGNVGSGTLEILVNHAAGIAQKLGFPLEVAVVCSPRVAEKKLPEGLGAGVLRTTDWREVVNHPEVEIVAELVGGTGVAREAIEAATRAGKSVVTANKELLALHGAALWKGAIEAGANLAMEASVAGGIPIHTVLREGIAGDRVAALFGILNGTSNYILTEIEQKGSAFEDVLKEAQRLGYAEADPTADIDGYDARSKLAILAALAFGEQIAPADIYTEGIRRVTPLDFEYAHTLKHTIRLIGSARRVKGGLAMSVRPTLLAQEAIMASVNGAYNAVWVRGEYGQDTFYYGRGAGPHPTGVAVVSDLMRMARELRAGSPQRVSPFAHAKLESEKPVSREGLESAFYLRFKVKDQTGIISSLAGILAEHGISIDAVLQLPGESKASLPFVITVEPAPEGAMAQAIDRMAKLPFMIEAPVAMPMEKGV
ncbi:MAG: homoserine dehydrogenase [Bryobacteraceae bacterium]|nr:homoserine dehydrogenase [Bryobacteraceae bacterium]